MILLAVLGRADRLLMLLETCLQAAIPTPLPPNQLRVGSRILVRTVLPCNRSEYEWLDE